MAYIVLCLCSLAALAAEGAAKWIPPVIGETRKEVADDDFTRSSGRTTAFILTQEAGDSIDDSTFPGEDIPGVEKFTGRLDKELVDHGVDVPRHRILKNAEKAWGVLGEGYEPLRDSLIPLAEARDVLGQGIIPTLQDMIALPDEAERSRLMVSPGVTRTVDRRSAAHRGLVERYHALIEEVRGKITEAQPLLDRAEEFLPKAFDLSRLAGELDADSHFRSSSSRTRDLPAQGPPPFNSKRVIHGATLRLEAAVKQARKVQVLLDKLTEPEKGFLRKAAESAPKTTKRVMLDEGCKECGIGPTYATVSQDSKEGSKSGDPDKEKARFDDEAAKAMLAKAEEQYSRIEGQELGDQELEIIRAELPESLSAPHSRAKLPPQRARRGAPGKEVRSRKIRHPTALSLSGADYGGSRLWTGER
ncbi:MAG: hypothetical protein WC728_19030 [Elusimicrobiota bacterium]